MATLYQHTNRQKIVVPVIPNSNQSWTTRLAFDESNGSTTITDSASSPKAYAVQGGAGTTPYITTSAKKYGTGSLYLPGGSSNSGVKASSTSVDFQLGTGDYTAECWFYITSWGPGIGGSWFNVLFDTRTGSWPSPGLQVCFTSGRKMVAYTGSGVFLTSATTFTTNTWYHMAIVRSSGTTSFYVNGVFDASTTTSPNFTTQGMIIGTTFDYAGGGDFRGYIDEFRLLKGTCLYSSSFTP